MVLGVGGFRVASDAITIANLVSFILFLFMMIMPLTTAFGAINSVNQALGALGRIQEIIGLPTETEEDSRIADNAAPPIASASPAPRSTASCARCQCVAPGRDACRTLERG